MSDPNAKFPTGENQNKQVARRQAKAIRWSLLFQATTVVAIIALSALVYNIVNGCFGYVLLESRVHPKELVADGLEWPQQSDEQLIALITGHMSKGLRRRYEKEMTWDARTRADLEGLVVERVIRDKVIESWSLKESLLDADAIAQRSATDHPECRLEFRSWVNTAFLTSPQSSKPLKAGIRAAILGSLLTILVTILFAFPIGVGAAIYLEEYAKATRLNYFIQTNINNLAGVPSIIYGILGLAVFVRGMEPITSGSLFGVVDETTASGRTILAAGLTLGLLVLPLLIINGQEALRAVPRRLREASLGLGATKWQTIWHHVLPRAMPGVMTGAILSISRALGETAPLVVVGASTFIAKDPTSVFSKFTTLPVQVYQWTSRPQPEFRHLAAAAILVLLVMLLSLNASAIIMRNRFRKNI